MDSLIRHLENKLLTNRVLGIFGSYSWSGGGVSALKAFGAQSTWKMVEPIIEAHYAPHADELRQCAALARNMAHAMNP